MSRRMQRSIAEELFLLFFFLVSFSLYTCIYLNGSVCSPPPFSIPPRKKKSGSLVVSLPSPGTGDYFVLCMLHQYIYIMYISTYVSSIYIIHIYLSTSLMCISFAMGFAVSFPLCFSP